MPDKMHSRSNSFQASMRAVFLNHPESIGESYFQHLRAAMSFAGALAFTAAAAFVHALVPCLCETTARNNIERLHSKLQSRATDNHDDYNRNAE